MTASERREIVARRLDDAVDTFQRVRQDAQEAILEAGTALVQALSTGRKVLVCGNGGSAADAQHFAAEFVGRFERERRAWPVVALTTDTSILTAVANDYGFDRIFARQVEAHGQPGDVLVGISTSGASPNVLAAVAAARGAGLTTIGLTGRDGGALGRAVDIHLNVASASTARTQEAHCAILHVLCELVERELTGA